MKRLRRPTSGFTLIEALLALVVLGLAASSGYAVLRTVIRQYQTIRDDAAASSQLAVASAILARDLRGAYLSAEQRQTAFVGRPSAEEPGSRIDFCQMPGAGGSQPAEVGYFFKRRPDGAWQLWRRFQDPLDADPLSGGQESLVCASLTAFQVRYFDGGDWAESWGWDAERRRPFEGIRGLPLAASVHLAVATPHGEESRDFTVPIMVALLNKGRYD